MRTSKKLFSIVIPTFNRSHYLNRQLKYLFSKSKEAYFDVIVVDGSDSEVEIHSNEAICDANKCFYQHFPSDLINPYERMLAGVNQADTEFVQLLADDDFLNLDSAIKAAQFLSTNQDYVNAYGNFATFRVDPEVITVSKLTDGDNIQYDDDNPFYRLFWYCFDGDPSTYWSMYRKQAIRKALSIAIEYNQKTPGIELDVRLGDPLFGSSLKLLGKTANIGSPYLIREIGQSHPRQNITAGDEMLLNINNFHSRYELLKKLLLDLCPDYIEKTDASSAIDSAFGAFLGGRCLSPNKMLRRIDKTFPAYSRIAKRDHRRYIRENNTIQSSNLSWIENYLGVFTRFIKKTSIKNKKENQLNQIEISHKVISDFSFALPNIQQESGCHSITVKFNTTANRYVLSRHH